LGTIGTSVDLGVLADRFDATLSSLIGDLASTRSDKTILRMTDGYSRTAAELWRDARSVAAGLADLGVRSGDRVAVMLPNSPAMVNSFLGTTLLGAIFVPMNTAWRSNSLAHVLGDSEPAAVIVHAAHVSQVRPHLSALTPIPPMIVAGTSELGAEEVSFAQLLETEPAAPGGLPRAEDLASLLYTSGTTGRAKGTMFTHRASLWMAATAAATMSYTAGDVIHTCLPLFHANALHAGLVGALWSDAEVVIAPRFTAGGFWEELRDAGATHTALLGSMMPLLMSRPAGTRDRDHHVHTAYCAPMPENVAAFEARFGLKTASTYGLTDANIMTIRLPDSGSDRSCGFGSPEWDLALVDDNDLPVPAGEIGELVGRPRLPYIAASGYWRNPEATTELWRNLWLHTGDLMRQDEAGRFYFLDRKKDALRKGGENVSSVEVETVLLNLQSIQAAAVFGVPSELSEDEVMAVIVPVPGSELTPEEVFAECARELPYFAVPRYIEFAEELPQTGSHRVRKAELRARGVTDRTWDAGPVTRRRFEDAVK
jgi:carnitine-CoA ligase